MAIMVTAPGDMEKFKLKIGFDIYTLPDAFVWLVIYKNFCAVVLFIFEGNATQNLVPELSGAE